MYVQHHHGYAPPTSAIGERGEREGGRDGGREGRQMGGR